MLMKNIYVDPHWYPLSIGEQYEYSNSLSYVSGAGGLSIFLVLASMISVIILIVQVVTFIEQKNFQPTWKYKVLFSGAVVTILISAYDFIQLDRLVGQLQKENQDTSMVANGIFQVSSREAPHGYILEDVSVPTIGEIESILLPSTTVWREDGDYLVASTPLKYCLNQQSGLTYGCDIKFGHVRIHHR